MQRPIEAVINLRHRRGLRADMVSSLAVEIRGQGHSGPIPRSGLDGKFSVEYCAAAALLDGHVGIDTFTDERRFSPNMEETLHMVRVVPNGREQDIATATAILTDGRTVADECRNFRGSAANPMSREERVAKFKDCAHRVLSDKDTERLLGLLDHLEELPSIAPLMAILVGRS